MACYLSLYLDVPLPSNTFFLGEVECRGQLNHPVPLNKHYLDFCLEEGFTRIVGSTQDLEAIRELAKQDCYAGIELIGLDLAIDIVPKLFKVLAPAAPQVVQQPEIDGATADQPQAGSGGVDPQPDMESTDSIFDGLE